jgi:hypothetical protein
LGPWEGAAEGGDRGYSSGSVVNSSG